MSPAITVLISAYNDRALVPKKLAEIQAQTLFVQAEFIFIETGSPGRERELFEPDWDGKLINDATFYEWGLYGWYLI